MLKDDRLVHLSLAELAAIGTWARERPAGRQPGLVLIGGWAVHAYNPWYGSRDIDFIGTRRDRKSLLQWLRDDRGFVPDRRPGAGVQAVEKQTPAGSVIVEFLRPEAQFMFEGTTARFPPRTALSSIVWKTVEGVHIPVPSHEILFLLKAKAAWDRGYRLDHGTSFDPAYERDKVAKDAGDLLALLDVEKVVVPDFALMARQMQPYRFVLELFQKERLIRDGAERYGIDEETATEWFNRLLMLLP